MLADANIKYLYKNQPVKKSGRTVVATIEHCGPKMVHLTGLDYIVQAGYEQWNHLTDDQKVAVVDHELAHCEIIEDEETGDIKYKLKDHDWADFTDVVTRHGMYLPDLEGLDEVFKK